MTGWLFSAGLVGTCALLSKRSVSGVGRSWYGGNSGYHGYSMSNRAVEAREEGRYPKTDFKRVYDMNDKTLKVLVDLGIISDKEWHHTSKFGNKTIFYGWNDIDDEYLNIWNENKSTIKHLVKNDDFECIAQLFDVEYEPHGTEHVKVGDELNYLKSEWFVGTLTNAVVAEVLPNSISIKTISLLNNGEFYEEKRNFSRNFFGQFWEVI